MQDSHHIVEQDFEKISKTLKNSTGKPRNFSLRIYQKRLEVLPVYNKERMTLYKVFNVSSLSQLDPSSVMTD